METTIQCKFVPGIQTRSSAYSLIHAASWSKLHYSHQIWKKKRININIKKWEKKKKIMQVKALRVFLGWVMLIMPETWNQRKTFNEARELYIAERRAAVKTTAFPYLLTTLEDSVMLTSKS